MYSKNYWNKEAEKVNGNTFNAGGFGENMADDFANGNDDWADGSFGSNYADGADDKEQVSLPYVITAQNTTTTDITDVEMLLAVSRQSSFATSGVTYGMKSTDITYQQFLQWVASGTTFKVAQTSLIANGTSASNNAAQVQESLVVNIKEPNGRSQSIQLFPRLDRFQQQANITELSGSFWVKPFTSLKVTTLKASVKLDIYLYPKAQFDASKAVNQGAGKGYSKPNVR